LSLLDISILVDEILENIIAIVSKFNNSKNSLYYFHITFFSVHI